MEQSSYVDGWINRVRFTHLFDNCFEGDLLNMNRAGIEDGDYLLVRQQQDAGKNDKVIVLIGDEATCKYLKFEDGLPALVPSSDNPLHKKRILLEDFSVLGVVEEVITPERRVHV